MKGQKLEVVFKLGSVNAADVLAVLCDYLRELGVPDATNTELYERNVPLNELVGKFHRSRKHYFNVALEGLTLRFAVVSAYKHILLCIENESVSIFPSFDEVVARFISTSGFVQAITLDREFQVWQNMVDIEYFKSCGKSVDSLLLVDNGRRPPLKRMEVDVSKNLGLRNLKNGYVETIGAKMWLGADFWRLSGVDRGVVQEVFETFVENVGHDVLKIEVDSQPFDENSDQKLQKRLWEVLFNKKMGVNRH